MVRTYFESYGEIEDLRVINDKKKTKIKRYGFVLFKNEEALLAVTEEGMTHNIAPGIQVDCKQTLLREELKLKQLEENDYARPMTVYERKQMKKAKKRLRRLKKKMEKLDEQGKDIDEIQKIIDEQTHALKEFKESLKPNPDGSYSYEKSLNRKEGEVEIQSPESLSEKKVQPENNDKGDGNSKASNFTIYNSDSSAYLKYIKNHKTQEEGANNITSTFHNSINNQFYLRGNQRSPERKFGNSNVVQKSVPTQTFSREIENVVRKIQTDDKLKLHAIQNKASITSNSMDYLDPKNQISKSSNNSNPLDGFGFHRKLVYQTKSEIYKGGLKY